MDISNSSNPILWPELLYEKFSPTSHLLHMGSQAIGKIKLLLTPFEPQWANIPLWITCRGLTTGVIPYKSNAFSIDMDMINHKIICETSLGKNKEFKLQSMSVAQLVSHLFDVLHSIGIDIKINLMPQEIPNPISFDKDTEKKSYDSDLAHAWWQILLNSYHVFQQYHARFLGKTPPIGFMWGTFDLRDARYNGIATPTTGINAEYIRRNAMNEGQIESGWWSGNPAYPRAAYYSFTYPQPEGIEQAKIKPAAARWDKKMSMFLLDYDDLRQSKNPEKDLLDFLESTYQAGAEKAKWDPKLTGNGKPV